MKEQIQTLKQAHPTYGYKRIAKLLNCSPSLVKYHLRPEVRKQHRINMQNHRRKNPLKTKAWRFMLKKRKNDFSRILSSRKAAPQTFAMDDLLRKIGEHPRCYLTGRTIDLSQTRSYEFDHIVSIAQGGDNSLSNLGLACTEANRAKRHLSVDDFLFLCKEITEFNGFHVSK